MGSKKTALLWRITELVEMSANKNNEIMCRVALADIKRNLINAGYIKETKSTVQEGE